MLSRARLTSRPSSRETGPEFLRKSQGAVPAPLGKLAPKVAQASEALHPCSLNSAKGRGPPRQPGWGRTGLGTGWRARPWQGLSQQAHLPAGR